MAVICKACKHAFNSGFPRPESLLSLLPILLQSFQFFGGNLHLCCNLLYLAHQSQEGIFFGPDLGPEGFSFSLKVDKFLGILCLAAVEFALNLFHFLLKIFQFPLRTLLSLLSIFQLLSM